MSKQKSTRKPVEIQPEAIELKAGDETGVEINDAEEVVVLDAEQAQDLNEQIKESVVEELPASDAVEDAQEIQKIVNERIAEIAQNIPVNITSTEIEVVSSEFHNFGTALFEKDKPTFLTARVLDDLMELPNFKDLVCRGVVKVGL